MMNTDIKIGCIVLAAGHSTRFGSEDKLLAELNGKRLAEWVLDALPTAEFAYTNVVTSSDKVSALCRSKGFTYTQYAGGSLSDSIRIGLGVLPETLDGIMFINADRPFIRNTTLLRMIECFKKSIFSAVRLTWQGKPSNPIIFPIAARQALEELKGDKGGSAVLRAGLLETVNIEAESEDETVDIDNMVTLIKYKFGEDRICTQ